MPFLWREAFIAAFASCSPQRWVGIVSCSGTVVVGRGSNAQNVMCLGESIFHSLLWTSAML